MSQVSKLLATDETFREVADLLFGGGADELIAKMNPEQSDVGSKGGMSDRTKRRLTAGLSAVGATAGAAGLGYAGVKTGGAYRAARLGAKATRVKGAKPIASRWSAAKTAAKKEPFGTALVPLEVAGLGGEVMATRILHGDTKKKQGTVAKRGALVRKDLGEMLNNATESGDKSLTKAKIPNAKRLAQRKGIEYASKNAGKFKKLPKGVRGHADVEKRVEVTWSGDIAKANEEKQQIFGWASVVEVNGEPVVDLQGDAITAEEMEKAGYEYVMKSRKGGDMHLRDNWSPIQKSEMIESFIVTDEKREAMGLPGDIPTGWWVGFQVRDPEVWAKVKSGERTGFSIHGHGRRTPVY